MDIKIVYEKALNLYNSDLYDGQTRFYLIGDNLEEEIKHSSSCICGWKILQENNGICQCDHGKWLTQSQMADFELVSVHLDQGAKSYIKIMKKDIGFTFKVTQNDSLDQDRIQFVYDVTIVTKNEPLLLPFAKKIIPKFEKIDKKFPGKVSKDEYSKLDIHSKDRVIEFIKKILS